MALKFWRLWSQIKVQNSHTREIIKYRLNIQTWVSDFTVLVLLKERSNFPGWTEKVLEDGNKQLDKSISMRFHNWKKNCLKSILETEQ